MAGLIPPFSGGADGVTVIDEAVTFEESDVTVEGYSNVVDGSVKHEYVTFDIANVSYSGTSFSVDEPSGEPRCIRWGDDGYQLFAMTYQANSVFAYDCSTAYDISTASYSTSLDVSSVVEYTRSMAWNDDGSQLVVMGQSTDSAHAYDLTTPYDLSTASYSGTAFDLSGQDDQPKCIRWDDDGSQLFMSGILSDNIYAYDLTTPYDLSTASYSGTSISPNATDWGRITDIEWKDDGSQLYMTGLDSASVHAYDLTTPYDLSTASYSGTAFDLSGEDGDPASIAWNNDGSTLHMYGSSGSIFAYPTTSPALPVESTITWSSTPADLKFWDLATYQASPDGGSVTVDVVDADGTVLLADIPRDIDISSVDTSVDVRLRVTLDGVEGENAPALDYAARRSGR